MDLSKVLNDDGAQARPPRPARLSVGSAPEVRTPALPQLQTQTSHLSTGTPSVYVQHSAPTEPSTSHHNSSTPSASPRPPLRPAHSSSGPPYGHQPYPKSPSTPHTSTSSGTAGLSHGYPIPLPHHQYQNQQQHSSPSRTPSTSTSHPTSALPSVFQPSPLSSTRSDLPEHMFASPCSNSQGNASFGPPLVDAAARGARGDMPGPSYQSHPPGPGQLLRRDSSNASMASSVGHGHAGPVSRQQSLPSLMHAPSPGRQPSRGEVEQHAPRQGSLSLSPRTQVMDLSAGDATRPERQNTTLQRANSTQSVTMLDVRLNDNSNPLPEMRTKQADLTPALAPVVVASGLPDSASNSQKRSRTSESSDSPVKRLRVQGAPSWAKPAKSVRLLTKYARAGSGLVLPSRARVNGDVDERMAMPPKLAVVQDDIRSTGPLGYLEKTFCGDVVPHEDLTRRVCDWLFTHVVLSGVEGAQLEIEAKIGTILTRHGDGGERIHLPVASEVMLAEQFDVGFESLLTLEDHRMYNAFLNRELAQSRTKPPPGKRPRVAMTHEHLREYDTFHALAPGELAAFPPAVRANLAAAAGRRAPRVRVTRERDSGAVKARVIKARVADLHVHNPNYRHDFRVSVNLEAGWPPGGDGESEGGGGVVEAVPPEQRPEQAGAPVAPARWKDRLSYTHGQCRVDLTQVRPARDAPAGAALHELEVELDARALRAQGRLVLAGDPANQYQELVETFVDNVRVLVRAIAPAHAPPSAPH